MKKLVIGISAFALVVIAFVFSRDERENSYFSVLSMENVEALGYDEGGGGEFPPFKDCYREIVYEGAQDTRTVVYCVFGWCEEVTASKAWDEYTCVMN